jgi:plasma kallikrein
MFVRAGEWDTKTDKEPLKHFDNKVKEIIVHPDYAVAGLLNDIALIVLEKEVADEPHIGTVCLPTQYQEFDQTNCVSSGWGKNQYGKEGKYQVILKKIQLPIVKNRVCQEKLRKTKLGLRFILHKSFHCAGGEEGVDTCQVRNFNAELM